jgi:hypothetical protein
MKTTEEYLAQIFKAMSEFQSRQFDNIESQDAALTELLGLPGKILSEMDEKCDTTPNYWECDCKDKYIHTQGSRYCHDCCSRESDSADARISDVVRNFMNNGNLA